MIDFINVEKTYKSGVEALRGVNFTIEDGEFVFVIGKSGSGKSTLLKCITCEETPTSGKVTIDNFDISAIDFAAAGNAINGIATYIEKTDDSFDNNEPVTQEDVNKIVNGLADNELILSLVTQGEEVPTLVEIQDTEHKQLFETAISGSSLSADDKDALRALFGING